MSISQDTRRTTTGNSQQATTRVVTDHRFYGGVHFFNPGPMVFHGEVVILARVVFDDRAAFHDKRVTFHTIPTYRVAPYIPDLEPMAHVPSPAKGMEQDWHTRQDFLGQIDFVNPHSVTRFIGDEVHFYGPVTFFGPVTIGEANFQWNVFFSAQPNIPRTKAIVEGTGVKEE